MLERTQSISAETGNVVAAYALSIGTAINVQNDVKSKVENVPAKPDVVTIAKPELSNEALKGSCQENLSDEAISGKLRKAH